ncbi:hypothetical protein VTJ83DRAFT_6134 [Remersonia thermophila]|uniref:Uncharacterized protein n=1 Tax=Remersonia thermophila TaxID=72144 RepID=A0ABR4D8U1_9PEZI
MATTTRRGPTAGLRAMLLPLLAACLWAGSAQGQDPSKKPIFLYPPPGSSFIYNKMDTVLVTYEAFYDQADFWIFCEPGKGKFVSRQKAPGWKATVPAVLNFTSDTPCWFNVRTGENGTDGANSAYFNVIGQVRQSGPAVHGLDVASPSSSSPPSTSSPSATGTTSQEAEPTTPTTTPTTAAAEDEPGPTPSGKNSGDGEDDGNDRDDAGPGRGSSSPDAPDAPESGSGLGAGASAGIGIGAAVGVLAVAGGLFLLWRRQRRRSHRSQPDRAAEMEGDSAPPYGGAYQGYGPGYGSGYGGGGASAHGGSGYGDGSEPGGCHHHSPSSFGVLPPEQLTARKNPWGHGGPSQQPPQPPQPQRPPRQPAVGELSAADGVVEIQDQAAFVGPNAWARHYGMPA